MNVLYITTRQWNPGDEFIMAGVKNVLSEIGLTFSIQSIYNKSPQVFGKLDKFNPLRMSVVNYSSGLLDSFFKTGHFDNSFSAYDNIDNYDLVVFCGSPGWFGGRLDCLYKKLQDYKGKLLYIGIGSSNRKIKLSALEASVMRQADFVSCRDERLSKALSDQYQIKNHFITCPAFLASKIEAAPTVNQGVGLVYVSAKTHRGHRGNLDHEVIQNGAFQKLIESNEAVDVICNYQAEIDQAAKLFGRERVRYEYDALDYARLLSEYSVVVSSRVHGCGLASSVGVPNIMIGHDKRAKTVEGFGSLSTMSYSEIDEFTKSMKNQGNLTKESERILNLKRDLMSTYVSLLKPVLS